MTFWCLNLEVVAIAAYIQYFQKNWKTVWVCDDVIVTPRLVDLVWEEGISKEHFEKASPKEQ